MKKYKKKLLAIGFPETLLSELSKLLNYENYQIKSYNLSIENLETLKIEESDAILIYLNKNENYIEKWLNILKSFENTPVLLITDDYSEIEYKYYLSYNLNDIITVNRLYELPSKLEKLNEYLLSKSAQQNNLNKYLQSIIDKTTLPILITDINGIIKNVNKKLCEITLYTENELIGQKTNIFKSGKNADYVYKQMWDKILSGESWTGNLINKRKDSTFYSAEVHILPILDNDKITGFIAYQIPLSNTLSEFHNIKDSDNLFRFIWENSVDGMRLLDAEGTIILVNDAFCKMVDKDCNELIGKKFNVIYEQNEDKYSLQKYKDNFLTENIPTHLERELTFWNKKTFWFELTNYFIHIDEGNKYLLSIFRNITEIKKLLFELRDANEKAQIMIRTKTNFLANMSHELRTPMIAIIGYS